LLPNAHHDWPDTPTILDQLCVLLQSVCCHRPISPLRRLRPPRHTKTTRLRTNSSDRLPLELSVPHECTPYAGDAGRQYLFTCTNDIRRLASVQVTAPTNPRHWLLPASTRHRETLPPCDESSVRQCSVCQTSAVDVVVTHLHHKIVRWRRVSRRSTNVLITQKRPTAATRAHKSCCL